MVPTVRTQLNSGESLPVRLILYGIEPSNAVIRFRPLGKGEYQEAAFAKVDRGVYRAEIPAGSIPDDFEYYISIRETGGAEQIWPATAPEMNQTVVVEKRDT
jgi:hypothetical protein